jgi:hypothetical protein
MSASYSTQSENNCNLVAQKGPNASTKKNPKLGVNRIDKNLSIHHFTYYAGFLPLYANLLNL